MPDASSCDSAHASLRERALRSGQVGPYHVSLRVITLCQRGGRTSLSPQRPKRGNWDWGWRPTKESFAEALKTYEVRSVPFAGPVSSLPFSFAEAVMCLLSLSRICWARAG